MAKKSQIEYEVTGQLQKQLTDLFLSPKGKEKCYIASIRLSIDEKGRASKMTTILEEK